MAVWAFATAVSAACARHEATANPVDGVLVLEVGGEQSSLRQALVAVGVDVAPAHLREVRRESVEPEPVPAPTDAPAPRATPQPRHAADDGPNPAETADHVVVELGKGETLMQLAKKHLGSGTRYHEILEKNGWTEADARRLRAGQLVKVPIDRATPGR